MRFRVQVLSLALASVLWLAGNSPAGAQAEETPAVAPLMVTLTTDRVYHRPGEPVVMRLAIRNTGTEPYTLRFSSSQRYDFLVRHVPSGQVVWQWSLNRYFLWVFGGETLQPGETRVWTEEWKQQTNNQSPVPTGIYRLEAVVASYAPQPLPSNWTFIQIGRWLF